MTDETYTVRLRGDRPDLRFLDGDLLHVRRQHIAQEGQIVVTQHPDGTYTLTRHDGTSQVAGLVLTMHRRLLEVVS